MNHSTKKRERKRRQRIKRRLRVKQWEDQPRPMFRAEGIVYELAERARGLATAGIGAIHQLVRRVGLAETINSRLILLKKHLPYWESDHVLNIAYNILCGGTCLEDIELRRNDEVYTMPSVPSESLTPRQPATSAAVSNRATSKT